MRVERVDVVGVRGGEVLRGLLRGEHLLRRLLRLRRGGERGRREVRVLEVAGPDAHAVPAPREARRRDAVAAQSLLQFKGTISVMARVPSRPLSTQYSSLYHCHLLNILSATSVF